MKHRVFEIMKYNRISLVALELYVMTLRILNIVFIVFEIYHALTATNRITNIEVKIIAVQLTNLGTVFVHHLNNNISATIII
jgi:hypothetical protein